MPVAYVDQLVDSMAALARRSNVAIIGGNIARSPGPLVVDVTATGTVHRRRILARSGGRAGDDLYVTGTLGGAALGLRTLQANHADNSRAAVRYRRPEPRLRFGLLLGRNRAARACVDLSDGLADGVRQIGTASGVGAIIDARALPLEAGATTADALSGGEDYELLFAVSPKLRRRLEAVHRLTKELPITKIGRLTAGGGFLLEHGTESETLAEGFAHFGT
jgi:thiamine-monophosphate kinase